MRVLQPIVFGLLIQLDNGGLVVACGLRGVSKTDRLDCLIVGLLEDVPYVLGCMAEFAACNAGTKIELADGNTVILDMICKVIVALGHGADEDGNALVLVEAGNVIADTYNF